MPIDIRYIFVSPLTVLPQRSGTARWPLRSSSSFRQTSWISGKPLIHYWALKTLFTALFSLCALHNALLTAHTPFDTRFEVSKHCTRTHTHSRRDATQVPKRGISRRPIRFARMRITGPRRSSGRRMILESNPGSILLRLVLPWANYTVNRFAIKVKTRTESLLRYDAGATSIETNAIKRSCRRSRVVGVRTEGRVRFARHGEPRPTSCCFIRSIDNKISYSHHSARYIKYRAR